MQQEEKFLHLQCDRIMSVDVNMLITENAIPVAVLDLLTKKGISVLANVKVVNFLNLIIKKIVINFHDKSSHLIMKSKKYFIIILSLKNFILAISIK